MSGRFPNEEPPTLDVDVDALVAEVDRHVLMLGGELHEAHAQPGTRGRVDSVALGRVRLEPLLTILAVNETARQRDREILDGVRDPDLPKGFPTPFCEGEVDGAPSHGRVDARIWSGFEQFDAVTTLSEQKGQNRANGAGTDDGDLLRHAIHIP
jgi:hypothetical protein